MSLLGRPERTPLQAEDFASRPVVVASADESDRLAREAAALFRVIMAAEAPPRRCQFDTDWSQEAVPEDVARKFLGLTLHSDLAPPFQTTNFEDVLDPEKKQKVAFCDRAAAEAFQKARFDAFTQDKSAKKVRIERTAFTFPVFDDGYRKAIVVVARSGIERDRLDIKLSQMKPGDVIRHPGDLAEFAAIYAKVNGAWKLIASELIGQS